MRMRERGVSKQSIIRAKWSMRYYRASSFVPVGPLIMIDEADVDEFNGPIVVDSSGSMGFIHFIRRDWRDCFEFEETRP